MAGDWLLYYMLQPTGLLLIAAGIFVPFIFWKLILDDALTDTGYRPLVVGYLCAVLGLLFTTFLWSYFEFSRRVSGGILQESQRWSIVPGWTISLAILALVGVLPLIALAGVPVAAVLLRIRKFTYSNIAISSLTIWLLLTLFRWVSPMNEWHRAHRLESFTGTLSDLLPCIILIAVPFFVGIRRTSNPVR